MLKNIVHAMGVESGAHITGDAYNFICKFPLAPLQHHHSTSFIN